MKNIEKNNNKVLNGNNFYENLIKYEIFFKFNSFI